jgi:16S rRNA (cytidine1402-2'-O)-methyltransferase
MDMVEAASARYRRWYMSTGTLYVVATPLGNLADLTPRAADILRDVSIVAAEDTRRSRTLLTHVGAKPRVLSFHAHSPPARLEDLLHRLRAGHSVALVTDAGTPTVSDPGRELVRRAREEDIPVVPAPGPSAVVVALSVSGVTADRFTFLGFLPRRGSERRRLLRHIAQSEWTVVVFEAPARLTALLSDLAAVCGGERTAVVARELTKAYEEVRAGTLPDLQGYYREHPPRGEITLVIEGVGRTRAPINGISIRERGRQLLEGGMSKRDAASRLASELNVPRNEAYRVITSL